MKNMSSVVRSVLTAGAGIVLSLSVHATDFSNTLADGGTVEIAQGAFTYKNGLGYRCSGSGTIKMTNDAGVEDGILCHMVEALHGTVVIDISECNFTTFSFGGGLVANGDGKVILKASDSLKTVYMGHPEISSSRQFDMADFEVQVDGAFKSDVDMVFRNMFCLIRPPSGYENWQIAAQSKVTLADRSASTNTEPTGPGDHLQKFYVNDVLDIGPDGLDLRELNIMTPNALTAGKTLKIGGTSYATIFLCYYNDWWNPWGLMGGLSARAKDAMRLKFNVILDGTYSALSLNDANGIYFDGDISGNGIVKLNNGGKPESQTFFNGKYSVTGKLTANISPKDNKQAKIVFTNPEGYLGDERTSTVQVELASNEQLVYNLGQGGGGYAASIALLKTSYQWSGDWKTHISTNASVSVSENTTLVINDLDGVVRIEGDVSRVNVQDSIRLESGDDIFLATTGHGAVSTNGMTGVLRKIVATAGTTAYFSDTLKGLEFVAESGSNVILGGDDTDIRITCKEGGKVAASDEAWMKLLDADILMWLDATRATTSTNIYCQKDSGNFKIGDVVTYIPPGQSEPVASIDNWQDWREGKTGIVRNRIYINEKEAYWLPAYANFYPHTMSDGPNGNKYISFHSSSASCRFHDYAWPSGTNPKFAVMVFGSQHGGGSAILPMKHAFGRDRSSYSNPIVTNSAYASGYFWVDGRAVDPTVTGFNGAWQIISCKIPDVVRGLGYSGVSSGSGADCGEQNYGEILFFRNELGDREREAVERYLARKWGLKENYGGADVKMKLDIFGKGTVAANLDTELSGGFEGNIAVSNAANVSVKLRRMVPGEEVVSGAKPSVWFDANCEKTLAMRPEANLPLMVDRWYSRLDVGETGAIADGAIVAHCYGSTARAPTLQESNGRKWIDFSNYYGFEAKSEGSTENDAVMGDVLRLGRYPDRIIQDTVPITNRVVFLAQDSSKGGGTAILNVLSGTTADLSPRYGSIEVNKKSIEELVAMPIWAKNSINTFGGGKTYLNGIEVDGRKTGLTGGPEVLTAVAGEGKKFGIGCFGYYSATDKTTYTGVGEIMGEVIAFENDIDELARTDIEAYLLWKWTGVIRLGYNRASGLSGAKITGNGVYLYDAQREGNPAMGADFTGEVQCSAAAYEFKLEGGKVLNPIDAGKGVVSFPDNVSISLAGDLANGEYTLISGSSISGDTTFSLAGEYNAKKRITLKPGDAQVVLEISHRPGFSIIVR